MVLVTCARASLQLGAEAFAAQRRHLRAREALRRALAEACCAFMEGDCVSVRRSAGDGLWVSLEREGPAAPEVRLWEGDTVAEQGRSRRGARPASWVPAGAANGCRGREHGAETGVRRGLGGLAARRRDWGRRGGRESGRGRDRARRRGGAEKRRAAHRTRSPARRRTRPRTARCAPRRASACPSAPAERRGGRRRARRRCTAGLRGGGEPSLFPFL